MKLYIVRHAWAVDRETTPPGQDAYRELTIQGRQRFACVARKLAQRGMDLGLIATSPLVRCRQTAEVLASCNDPMTRIVELPALAPSSDLNALIEWTAAHDEVSQVAWVGHAPDVGQMAAALIGNGSAWIRFAKGAVAAIRFETSPAVGVGEFQWHVTAKAVGC